MKQYLAQDLNFNSLDFINRHLETFKTNNLFLEPKEFQKNILGKIEESEGIYFTDKQESENQNIHMLKFHWGHDHDFGSFKMSGCMGTRHIWMLSRFFDHFNLQPESLVGKKILDVGCWTGGVSLVLASLGAQVLAIDEIGMYSDILNYQAKAFGLNNLEARQMSLFELESEGLVSCFDVVFCLGVIYHLSDPVVGMRRIYNSLKPEGSLYVESMSIDSEECICEYEGPNRRRGQFGWNWFVPSPRAIRQLLADVGFWDIHVGNGYAENEVTCENDPMGSMRCFASAKKLSNHKICKAGLSTTFC